jgi:NADH:ubiquinone oxidoreductase subunit K
MTERERTLRDRSPLVYILVALGTMGIFTLQNAVTWVFPLEILVFSAAYWFLYWVADKILFRRSDD